MYVKEPSKRRRLSSISRYPGLPNALQIICAQTLSSPMGWTSGRAPVAAEKVAPKCYMRGRDYHAATRVLSLPPASITLSAGPAIESMRA